MIVPGSASALLLRTADTGYKVERSLRFNSADSAYLSRTPASAGNRKTWTWSGWVKRGTLGSKGWLLTAGYASAPWFVFGFESSSNADKLAVSTSAGVDGSGFNVTNAVFRDPSAWYHILLAFDTTQATATDRIKIYVNNTLQSLATSNPPALNADLQVNNTVSHAVGGYSGEFFNGYLADIHFIDGQALTPSSFTEVSATTGQLIPKAYTGTFGTNGFWLKFSDNSAATATTLGKDYSGNGNNWTPNNLSVTAGAGNDSLVDTPTSYGVDAGNGGEVRGNYCTANPLDNLATLSNGNLQVASPSASYVNARGTIAFPATGKWYAEAVITSNTGSSSVVTFGLATKSASLSSGYGNASNMHVFLVGGTLICYNSTTVIFDVAGTLSAGDVMQIAYDADTGKVWVGANNTWRNSTGGTTGNPGAGTNQTFTLSAGEYFPFAGGYSNTLNVNWGQRSWAYTAPSGFKALCDTNLPAPVVAQPSTVMDVKLYTGNGSTQTISGLDFESDLIWIKKRSGAEGHLLSDTVRGIEKGLYSNQTSAEDTYLQYGKVSAVSSTGFTVAATTNTPLIVNESGQTYVAWTWDAGSSTVTNTQGSITSQVRANASAGFSIVTYTGAAAGTVGHGLGAAPGLIIAKQRNVVNNWFVYHSVLGTSQVLELSSTIAAASSSNYWGSSVTSTTFGTGPTSAQSNANGNIVAYCFAPVAGYSSFGSYVGNGNANGPFVYTGFRPRWVLVKSTSATGWAILDAARNTYNLANSQLFPHASGAELTSPDYFTADFLSNGFKLRTTHLASNTNTQTYIYAAFAESPFQYARAR